MSQVRASPEARNGVTFVCTLLLSYRQVVAGVDVKCAVCDAVATAAGQQQRDSPWRAHEEMQAAAWEGESERVHTAGRASEV